MSSKTLCYTMGTGVCHSRLISVQVCHWIYVLAVLPGRTRLLTEPRDHAAGDADPSRNGRQRVGAKPPGLRDFARIELQLACHVLRGKWGS